MHVILIVFTLTFIYYYVLKFLISVKYLVLTDDYREEFVKFLTFLPSKSADIGQFSGEIGQFSW